MNKKVILEKDVLEAINEFDEQIYEKIKLEIPCDEIQKTLIDQLFYDYEVNDFEDHSIKISINDQIVGEGNTENVMGSPLNSALWLINKIAKKGEILLKGQFISTGTCTKAHELNVNTKISADYGILGKIEFNYN